MFRNSCCAVALATVAVNASAQDADISKLREALRQLQQQVQQLERRLQEAESKAAKAEEGTRARAVGGATGSFRRIRWL
jgi:predicted  nucleic acid-binding Zn-ribbon protein